MFCSDAATMDLATSYAFIGLKRDGNKNDRFDDKAFASFSPPLFSCLSPSKNDGRKIEID